MSHYTMDYSDLPREQADAKAIADTRDYLGPEMWAKIEDILLHGPDTYYQIRTALWLVAGVQGLPLAAIGRRYRLEEYREWMQEGEDGVETDEQGFALRRREVEA